MQGFNEERHDINLLETVDKAHRAGIKFNPNKCEIKKQKVTYFGRVISTNGIESCSKKIKAISQLPPPENNQELQSFLGMVNFLSTFIPNLTEKTHLIRGLLKTEVHFVWTKDMQQDCEYINKSIMNTTKLYHFDPNKPAVLETDASQKRLRRVLIQDDKLANFVSKSLTRPEMEYSNIEHELLAVLYARERLHTYMYGCNVTVNTDHKPLESIFLKPISLAPPQLQ